MKSLISNAGASAGCILAALLGTAACAEPADRPGWTADGIVDAYRDFYGITGGAVAILRGDDVIYRRTFGDASVELGVPVTDNTRFQLSSTTKLFTGTLVTMLAAKGDLDMEDEVRDYLPGLPESWSDVRISDIMSHLSGLPEVLECDGAADREAALACAYALPRPAKRRETFSYNQTNYLLAMWLIERVTGQPYADVLAQRILEPAGMGSAVLNGNSRDVVAGRASDYEPDGHGGILLRQYEFPPYLLSAAGMNASLDDMIAFSTALTGGRLLDARARSAMWTPPVLADGSVGFYAIGWDLRDLRDGASSFGHEGGSLTTYRVYPPAGLAVIVLTNGRVINFGLDQFADLLALSADPDVLAPADSLAFRAKFAYVTGGVVAAVKLLRAETCAGEPDCERLPDWLAREMRRAGRDADAAAFLEQVEQAAE